ncbi:DNA recombination protein RmuC [Candidatus Clavichlamydia salmonicola]|uniref:DNA recombination protein RmuC n=1 Tax=Candidatus Clavichlamydia salmonicola TaxID=469812 RepID=UPI001890FD28|nr:DNA recombination protein RmuC [Candidatus Clavichlamydia salmonicola]
MPILSIISTFMGGIAIGYLISFIKNNIHKTNLEKNLQEVTLRLSLALEKEATTLSLKEEVKSASFQALNTFYEKSEHHFQVKYAAIDNLVKPVTETLHKFKDEIQALERKRALDHGSLNQQLENLFKTEGLLQIETSKLVRILQNPGTRGKWGEMQLRRVVELSGMIKNCDFMEQPTSEEHKQRPDLIIRLPGNKQIIVDAKAPFTEVYFNAVNEQDGALYAQGMREFTKRIRDNIKLLSQKSYWSQFDNTPEFVLLFLPGESFFSDALRHDPDLIEFGTNERVFITSPVTLLATLKTIAHSWKQENLNKQIVQVGHWGKNLYRRLSIMTSYWSKMGKNLHNAVDAYNEAVGNLEKRVLVSAREFANFEIAADDKIIEDLDPILSYPRSLQDEDDLLEKDIASVKI